MKRINKIRPDPDSSFEIASETNARDELPSFKSMYGTYFEENMDEDTIEASIDWCVPTTDIIVEDENDETVTFRKDNGNDDSEKPKRARTKDTKHYIATKTKAYKEFSKYKLEDISGPDSDYKFKISKLERQEDDKTLRFSLPDSYVVNFQKSGVNCTCPSYKSLKYGASGKGGRTCNEICKHIGILVITAPENFQNLYKGNASYTANEWTNIKILLENVSLVTAPKPTNDLEKKAIEEKRLPDPILPLV